MFGLGDTRTHTGHTHARAECVEQGSWAQAGGSPWAAVVRPHGGDTRDTARQRTQQLTQAGKREMQRHIANYAKHTKRTYATRAAHTKVLQVKFVTLTGRHGRATHTKREREKSAL